MRHAKLICLLVLLSIGLIGHRSAEACNLSAMLRSYNRAVSKFIADPTPDRANRICRILKRIHDKFPLFVLPEPPDGVTCKMDTFAGGRGGGPGGLIVGVGFGAPSAGWVRNPSSEERTFNWEIIPDPLNPPGFDIFPTTGTVLVPPQSSLPAPFDITVAGSVPPGAIAFFDILWEDPLPALPLPPDSSRFQVFADPEITLLPSQPFLLAEPGAPLPVLFEITNHTGEPITRTFDFVHHGDPASVMALNDGTPFDAINLFPEVKGPTSIEVTVPAFATEEILKETLIAGEICDPMMINCCGLQFGQGFCCAQIFNHDQVPPVVTPLFMDLLGQPTGEGAFGFDINGQVIQIPTNAAPTIPELLDVLTQQSLNAALNQNGFNFMPIPDDTGFQLLRPLDFDIFFFSNDPGLLWQPSTPPMLPLLPQWPQPDLMLQTVLIVNGFEAGQHLPPR